MLLVNEGLINCYINKLWFLLYFLWKIKLYCGKEYKDRKWVLWFLSLEITNISIGGRSNKRTTINLCFLKLNLPNVCNLSSSPISLSYYFYLSSTFSFAFLLPVFIMCAKKNLPCNITSGYFSETVWNLVLIIIRDKWWNQLWPHWDQWEFSVDLAELELHVEFNTDPLNLLANLIYL